MAAQSILSRGRFRTAFWVTTLIGCSASTFDIVLVNRWNVDWGIPDKVFYMFGDAMFGTIIGMLSFMPAVVLTSKAPHPSAHVPPHLALCYLPLPLQTAVMFFCI